MWVGIKPVARADGSSRPVTIVIQPGRYVCRHTQDSSSWKVGLTGLTPRPVTNTPSGNHSARGRHNGNLPPPGSWGASTHPTIDLLIRNLRRPSYVPSW